MTDINKTIEKLKELEAKAVSWKRAHEDEGCCVICDLARSHNYNDAVLAEALRNALPELLAEMERLEARAEKAEAERDVLAKEIAKREIMDWYSETEQPGDECRPDYWLEWAEREAASTDN